MVGLSKKQQYLRSAPRRSASVRPASLRSVENRDAPRKFAPAGRNSLESRLPVPVASLTAAFPGMRRRAHDRREPFHAGSSSSRGKPSRPSLEIRLQSPALTYVVTLQMDQGPQQLINETVEHVDTYWREHKVPLLLSTLGNVESGRFAREAKHHAESLRSFLEVEVGDRVLVVQHSKRLAVIGVVPSNEDTNGIRDWDALLDETGAKPQQRRLHPALWAAFRKPIGETVDRYVLAGESVRFIDVERGDEVPEGVRVDHALIVGPDAPPEVVYEKATAWLHDNHLEVSDFRSEATSRAGAKLPSNDLLGRMIVALDTRDLQKISIPMEIVAKLRRQAV